MPAPRGERPTSPKPTPEEAAGRPNGKPIRLRSGKVVVVRPWGAEMFLHQMQPRLAHLIGSVMPIVAGINSAEALRAKVPSLLTAAMGTLTDMVKETVGLQDADLSEITAAEFVMLARVMVEVNMDFFEEVAKLAAVGGGLRGLIGQPSPPASSGAA